MESSGKRNIVIIGGGVIGSTTAYYLTRHPKYNQALHRITLLEATSIAAGASGKSGGLLGLWAYPECLVGLSYRLHKELAEEHGGADRWGYRRVGCGHVDAVVTASDLKARAQAKSQAPLISAETTSPSNGQAIERTSAEGTGPDPLPIQSSTATVQPVKPTDEKDKDWEKLPKQDAKAAGLMKRSVLPNDLDWIDEHLIQRWNEMGMPGSTETAQVHPYYFTTAIAELAREKGVDVKTLAKVTRINHNKLGVRNVEWEDRTDGNSTHFIDDVTDVVVAAGPWTGKVLPRSKVDGLRAHSVVFDVDVSPYAVFTNIQLPIDFVPEHRAAKGQKRRHRGNVDPEVYARPGNEVYACGEPDPSIPLPETADLVQCDEAQCDDLVAYMGTISPKLGSAPIKAKQACYLPRHMRFGEERSPLVGETGVPGLYIASGHTCWGIQNGPGTGYLMAELLLDGEVTSADIEKLDPKKYKV